MMIPIFTIRRMCPFYLAWPGSLLSRMIFPGGLELSLCSQSLPDFDDVALTRREGFGAGVHRVAAHRQVVGGGYGRADHEFGVGFGGDVDLGLRAFEDHQITRSDAP